MYAVPSPRLYADAVVRKAVRRGMLRDCVDSYVSVPVLWKHFSLLLVACPPLRVARAVSLYLRRTNVVRALIGHGVEGSLPAWQLRSTRRSNES